jgi:hypothetical protein
VSVLEDTTGACTIRASSIAQNALYFSSLKNCGAFAAAGHCDMEIREKATIDALSATDAWSVKGNIPNCL